MFQFLFLILFGLIVGLVAKAIHPGDEPVGFVATVAVGIFGSAVGGIINWFLGSQSQFALSGFTMSILGGIICCAFWRWYNLKNSSEGPKSFISGKPLKKVD